MSSQKTALTRGGEAQEGSLSGDGYLLYHRSCLSMPQVLGGSVALTITSPPYWNAIDYDIHSKSKNDWHRGRRYDAFGGTYEQYLEHIEVAFGEVLRATIEGGFCAIVVGTILYKGRHFSVPMAITERMQHIGWGFHQDIIWNKVTGGVRRAGCYIQRPHYGYYYPNIMTEYILVFRKEGEVRRGSALAIGVDELFVRDIANNIWHIAPVPPRTIDHPCPFPEELARRLVLLYSQEGDVVLDPFVGSGQTALAALRHGRTFVGVDVERAYVELAQRRIEAPPPPRRFHLTNNLMPSYDKTTTL